MFILEWVLKRLKDLKDAKFTGSITFSFHEGNISRKVEIKRFETVTS